MLICLGLYLLFVSALRSDMNEVGDYLENFHFKVVSFAAFVDYFFTDNCCGQNMGWLLGNKNC